MLVALKQAIEASKAEQGIKSASLDTLWDATVDLSKA